MKVRQTQNISLFVKLKELSDLLEDLNELIK